MMPELLAATLSSPTNAGNTFLLHCLSHVCAQFQRLVHRADLRHLQQFFEHIRHGAARRHRSCAGGGVPMRLPSQEGCGEEEGVEKNSWPRAAFFMQPALSVCVLLW